MNITEIIAEIDEKYPNGLGSDSKVRKADILHKRIYRQLKKQNFYSIDLITDQVTYPLTPDISDVFQVDVRNASSLKLCKYPLRKVTDDTNNCSKYHYFISDPEVGDWIGIYPAPTDNEDSMTIYFYESPATLVVGGPSPMLNEKYHMMLVYGVCKEIAENYRDTDLASGFALQYNALESEMLGYIKDSDVITVKNGMGW